MKNQVLSIDLGSAYTKIALRNGSDAQSILVHDIPLASELTFCLPSVVANVRRGSQDNWLIGSLAASQLPGPNVTIYRNWKVALFGDKSPSSPPAENASAGSEISREDAVTVAFQFFSALRETLRGMRLERDVTTLPVRVCIPKFGDFDASEKRIAEIIERAGFHPASPRPALGEPEANALGILSRGSNKTWLPPAVDYQPMPPRSPNLPGMLAAPGFLQALHAVSGYYGVLVIDVGAYTTDFGYVRFDTSQASDLNKPKIIQQSYPVGIRNLDSAVRSRLSEEAQQVIRESATADWESRKQGLYRSEPAAFAKPRGGRLYVGQGGESKTIKDVVIAFADYIWGLRSRFCEIDTMAGGLIHAQALTGGGSMIPTVRNTLTSRVQVANGIPVRDLLGEEPVSRTTPGARATPSPQQIEAHTRQTRELVRGGSAIGGASVFFE